MFSIFAKLFSPLKLNKEVYGLTVILFLFYQACALTIGLSTPLAIGSVILRLTRIFGLFFALSIPVYFFVLLYRKEPHPIKAYVRLIQLFVLDWSRLVNITLLVFCVAINGAIYTNLKQAIPLVIPFYLDLPLHHIDQWLFAGAEPWQITHWLFSSPFATMVINVIYNLWFFYVLFFVAYLILSKQSNWKKQAFLVFFLTWFINGNVFATLMSSVGPCFYDYLNPQSPAYQGLMALLQEQNQYLIDNGWLELWSLNTQDMLWQSYQESNNNFGAGISAMPSMHNSMAILIALAVSQRHKGLGYCAWAFAVIIYIGSIHLGWHYATDGIVALVLTLIIWKVVGKFLARKAPQTLPPASEQSPL